MAHYFPERRMVRELFEIPIQENKIKVQCAIFERWEFRKGFDCKCGHKTSLKLGKTEGVSSTVSATIEGSIENTLGPAGLIQLKTSLKGTLGAAVNWTQTQTEELMYECDPPKCGACDLSIYQLMRDYELAIYRRGGIFKSGVWDKKFGGSIPEQIGRYTEVPDCVERYEKCPCPPAESKADYDGRVSIDFGNVCILAPYRLTTKGIDIRLARLVVSFPFYEYHTAVGALETALKMSFQRSFLPSEAIFLGNLEGDSFEADVRIYRDPGASTSDLAEILLQGSPSVKQITHQEEEVELS